MMTDPVFYIVAAACFGAALGFMACAVFSSSRIRRANMEGYLEAVRFQQEAAKEVGL